MLLKLLDEYSSLFFYQLNLFIIYDIGIWSRSKGSDIIWTNILYNILSNEWKLKVAYQQNFLIGKKL